MPKYKVTEWANGKEVSETIIEAENLTKAQAQVLDGLTMPITVELATDEDVKTYPEEVNYGKRIYLSPL